MLLFDEISLANFVRSIESSPFPLPPSKQILRLRVSLFPPFLLLRYLRCGNISYSTGISLNKKLVITFRKGEGVFIAGPKLTSLIIPLKGQKGEREREIFYFSSLS